MAIQVEKVAEQVAFLSRIAELEGEYSLKIGGGFFAVLFNSSFFTRWLYQRRQRQATAFAENADFLLTAVNALNEFEDQIVMQDATHKDLSHFMREFARSHTRVRHIPDIHQNYKYVMAICCFLAKHVMAKNRDVRLRPLNLTVEDLDGMLEKLSQVEASHANATFLRPPRILVLNVPES
ncbi:hypothetical protein [Roseicyclus marinus]|uniref:hypothetical protein n=1 Tax=Roseicyclus marinus TaxID=2161673 RepID=UPI0024107105|nr:hypothetical protein [Roseicyclus marinus]MDG3039811.1 hypothetical protein [Roseicyclus marinus]